MTHQLSRNQCLHGQLARACRLCELEAEIRIEQDFVGQWMGRAEKSEAEVERLRDENKTLQQMVRFVMESWEFTQNAPPKAIAAWLKKLKANMKEARKIIERTVAP